MVTKKTKEDFNMCNSPVIVALDFAEQKQALELVDKLDPKSCRLKVGKEMFTLYGPEFVKQLVAKGFSVFLDLKFHDIPTTTAKAVVAAAKLGVWMVNVHVGGGSKMLTAARSALDELPASQRPLLIGVTVLTSMQEQDLAELGCIKSPAEQVMHLATMAKKANLDGVVCSAHEASMLKLNFGDDFKLVTPGIRPIGSKSGDQNRIMTPRQALSSGADYLVIGRPITQACDPMQILEQILTEIKTVKS